MRRYRNLLRLRHAPRLVLGGIVARLPMSMMPLSLLLLVAGQTGSYAMGGLTAGLHAAAHAVAAPFLGRLADRIGSRPILFGGAVLYPTMIGAVLAAVSFDAIWWVLPFAALSGAVMPMVGPVLRTAWRRLADEGALRHTAFALDSVVVEIVYIGGPAAVAAFTMFASPGAAALAASFGSAVGAMLIASADIVGESRRTENDGDGPHRNPLRRPAVIILLFTVLAVMFAFGIYDVAITAFSGGHGNQAVAGVLLAIWSLGSAVGGIWYGQRHFAIPVAARFRWTLLALAAAHVPLALVSRPEVMAIVLLLAGLTIAPSFASQADVVAEIAPEESLTEAYTWVSTIGYIGLATGAAVGGLIVDQPGGNTWAFVIASASVTLAWIAAALGRKPFHTPVRRFRVPKQGGGKPVKGRSGRPPRQRNGKNKGKKKASAKAGWK